MATTSGNFGVTPVLRDNTLVGMGAGAIVGLLMERLRKPERRDYFRAALLSSLLGGISGSAATKSGLLGNSVVDSTKSVVGPLVTKGRQGVSDASRSFSNWIKPASANIVNSLMKSAASDMKDDDARLLALKYLYPDLDPSKLEEVNTIFGRALRVKGNADDEKFIKRRLLANVMLNAAFGGVTGGAVGRARAAFTGKDKALGTASGAAIGMASGAALSYLKSKIREKLGLDPILPTIGTARV